MARGRRIIERLKKMDVLVLLIGIVLFLVIVGIFIRAQIIKEEQKSNSNPLQNIDFSEQDINKKLQPEDVPEFKELLSAMPHFADEFTATYFPLEKNAKPSIQVEIKKSNGKEKFLDWYQKFNISDELSIQYIYTEEPLDSFPQTGNPGI